MAKNPDFACEVTLQPLERFELDAAILFSDILTVPDAMGLGLYFAEGEGPRFERPVVDEAAVAALTVPDPEDDLGYVMRAVRTIRRALGSFTSTVAVNPGRMNIVEVADFQVMIDYGHNHDGFVKIVRAIRQMPASRRVGVVTIPGDMGLDEIAALMVDKKFHTLPVVEKGRLVGVVGKKDIIKTLIPNP